MSTAVTASDAATRAATANRRLARTINVGLDLGAEEERSWTIAVTERQLSRCAEAGFTAVRLVAPLSLHLRERDRAQVDEAALARVREVVDVARAHGLAIVVANMRDPDLMADPAGHRDRQLANAQQLAAALRDCDADVMLEPLAEPQGALDRCWNEHLAELIATVRAVDRERTLLAGPSTYNNARFLGQLVIPEDERNLIVTFHHYWPIRFTMQGELWLGETPFGHPSAWLGTTWEGTEGERAELEAGFAAVAEYGRHSGRPLFLGEFGTSDNADPASRVRWTAFNRRLAERHGLSWGCWSLGPIFSVFDLERDGWRAELLAALME